MTTYSANTANPPAIQDIDQLCHQIRTDLQGSVEGFIAAGRRLIELKRLMPKKFLKRVKDLIGISADTAERLMAIAGNRVLTNSAHVRNLPHSKMTLAEMTRVAPKVLEAKLADGTWNTTTQRKDVVRFIREQNGEDAPIRLTPHDRFRHDQDRLVTLYVKDAAKFKEFQDIVASITKQVRAVPPRDHVEREEPLTNDDDEVAKIFAADKYGARPPPPKAPGPVQEMSAESIVPENAPVFEEDIDAADRSSGRPEDGSELDWRRKRAADLSRWHRG
jgi:hypothetical protein